MATLREVRRRIAGVKTTQKITRAMKMVATAKLRRAQTAVVSARPYARKLQELLGHLAPTMEASPGSLVVPRPVGAVAIVVVTSDRGLCGAFNTNVVRFVERHIASSYGANAGATPIRLFCIGRKGADYFARRGQTIGGRYIGVYDHMSFPRVREIVTEIVTGYQRGEYDRVEIVYNEFKSISQQRLTIEQFLPIQPAAQTEDTPATPTDYIYEPSAQALVEALVPKHLNFQLWRVLLESNAAEQGARMSAMENATENAEELISTLQLQYNKARQASITKELLEVVTGAEALTHGN
jgi:F-type H+-transporting ATPase subunit gamma